MKTIVYHQGVAFPFFKLPMQTLVVTLHVQWLLKTPFTLVITKGMYEAYVLAVIWAI